MANRKTKNRDDDALAYAIDAHENHFSTRRGTWTLEGTDRIVLYDNNPWAKYPTLRAEQMERLRAALTERGIPVVGEAAYPREDGYTLAWIIKSHDLTLVCAEWDKAIKWALEEIEQRMKDAKRPHLRLVPNE